MTVYVVPILGSNQWTESVLLVERDLSTFWQLHAPEGEPLAASDDDLARLKGTSIEGLEDVIGFALQNRTETYPDMAQVQEAADLAGALAAADELLAATTGGRVLRSDLSDEDRNLLADLEDRLAALATDATNVLSIRMDQIPQWQRLIARRCQDAIGLATQLRTRPLRAREDSPSETKMPPSRSARSKNKK